MFINIPKKHKKPEKISIITFKTDLMEGINIIKGNKFISTMIYLGTIINFVIAPIFSVGLVFIIKEILKATDFQFGIFQMILSASMIAAPIFASGYIKKVKVGKLCYLSFISIALSILIMAVIPSKVTLGSFKSNLIPYILLSIISFMVGVFATIANIAMGTIFNQVTPIQLMGRTSTVFNLAVTVFIPIGQMLFGYLYDIISPSYVIAISRILIVVVRRYKVALMELDEQEDGIREMR